MNRHLPWLLGALLVAPACTLSSPPSDALDELDALPRAGDTVATTQPGGRSSDTADTTAAPIDEAECERVGAESYSYAPSAEVEPGSFVAELRADPDRRLRVGVDENTVGFAFRRQSSGEIEGFEVDLAHVIAQRIMGDTYRRDRVELVPVVTGEKIEFVRDGTVDMSISANSMGCGRWNDVAFSAEYFTAHQEFLVRRDSPLDSADDLAELTVCVTAGSSSIGILEPYRPTLLEVDARTECLVALQQGEADAYFGHDSFLYGMLKQDPTVRIRAGILPPGETVSHYGIAISHERPDLVQYVNHVLEDIDADGTWAELYADLQAELAPPSGEGLPDATAPARRYREDG